VDPARDGGLTASPQGGLPGSDGECDEPRCEPLRPRDVRAAAGSWPDVGGSRRHALVSTIRPIGHWLAPGVRPERTHPLRMPWFIELVFRLASRMPSEKL